jgi:preprotein translocase subunit YajC
MIHFGGNNMFTSFAWLLDAVAPAATAAANAAADATAAAGTTAAADAAAQSGGMLATLIQLLPMAAIVVVFWFVLIRPQRKKDKAVKNMLAALKPGDRICTIGGVYATVTGIKDDTVTVVVGAQKTPLIFARWAIRSVEDAPLENDVEPQI